MTPARLLSTDELLFHLGQGLSCGALTKWESGFARSMLGAAKRGGPSWEPSDKQRRIINDLVDGYRSGSLVEPGDD